MSNPLEPLLNDIIARLERGVPPWRQPWVNAADPSMPLRADGQPFSGSNAWLLAFAGADRGFISPYWFTFRQALAIGAPVAKGSKGSLAILYKTRLVDGVDVEGSAASDSDPKVLRYLKTYAVFNAEQLTDCPAVYLQAPKVDPLVRAATRDAIMDAIPARTEIGGNIACYVPSADLIRMPAPEAFASAEEWKSTFAHELGLVASVLLGRARSDRPGPLHSFQHTRQSAPAIGGARDDRRRPATAHRAVFRSAAAFSAGRLRSPLVWLRRRGLALAGTEC